jgi:pimeloyl-ACP methyl ester carboxylesterase
VIAEQAVADSAGVRIAYEVTGAGPPLVLVHGLGYARWGWEPVAPALAETFTVVTLDNRGIGGSDVPPGPYSTPAMAEDVLAVLDAAGLDRAHVVGTSLGGMVAQELAIARPERLDRLVLACTTPGGEGAFPLPERTLQLLAEAPALAPDVALRRFVENALADRTVADRPELVQRIYQKRLEFPPDPSGWQAQAAAGATHDALSRLEQIEAPTLVLHGTDDSVVDARNAEVVERAIPNAQRVMVEGAGHLFFWEDPTRFVDVVRDFLNGAR